MDMQVSSDPILPLEGQHSTLYTNDTACADAHRRRPHLDQDDPLVRKVAPDPTPLHTRQPQRPSTHHRCLRLTHREGTTELHRRRLRRLDPQAHSFQPPYGDHEGIVDKDARKENLYRPGNWEAGGWFDEAQHDVFAADTAPSQQQPSGLESKTVAAVADDPDPAVKEEGESEQSKEQKRLLEVQEEERKAMSLPILDSQRTKEAEEGVTGQEEVASPPAID